MMWLTLLKNNVFFFLLSWVRSVFYSIFWSPDQFDFVSQCVIPVTVKIIWRTYLSFLCVQCDCCQTNSNNNCHVVFYLNSLQQLQLVCLWHIHDFPDHQQRWASWKWWGICRYSAKPTTFYWMSSKQCPFYLYSAK